MAGGREGADFAAIVEEYADYVYGVTYRLLGNPQDAEDASQETFLKLYRCLNRRNHEKSLKNWLCTIAINTARDFLRGRRRYQGTQGFDEERAHGAVHSQIELTLTVERMLESLKVNYRIAVVLFYLEGKSVEEIAGMLHRPRVVVKVWLHRARKMLIERFGGMIA